MESFLNRYRNITVLLLVLLAQLVLLSVQVKNDQDVRFIRVWTVTAVTPLAKLVDTLRGGGSGFVRNYIRLHDADADNRRLQSEVDRLKLENIFLKNQLNTADRAQALQLFQARTPSKTLAARVLSRGLGAGSMVYIDRGSVAGVMRGMAVVTPDGILGKVVAAYPMSSQVLLITDPDFVAGVVSTQGRAHGNLKGQGGALCKVDYVPFEDKVDPGDWFWASGDDRIFPSGFPVGVVKSVRPGQPFKEILLDPSGLWRGLEDVLIILDPVHQNIPDTPPSNQPVWVGSPPPGGTSSVPGNATPTVPGTQPAMPGTEADKLRDVYKGAGESQGHTFGEPDKLPDYTKLQGAGMGPVTPPGAAKGTGASKSPAPVMNKDTGPGAARRANQAAGTPPGGGR